jgi:hypothetical protein
VFHDQDYSVGAGSGPSTSRNDRNRSPTEAYTALCHQFPRLRVSGHTVTDKVAVSSNTGLRHRQVHMPATNHEQCGALMEQLHTKKIYKTFHSLIVQVQKKKNKIKPDDESKYLAEST